jgi:hypothetical protein
MRGLSKQHNINRNKTYGWILKIPRTWSEFIHFCGNINLVVPTVWSALSIVLCAKQEQKYNCSNQHKKLYLLVENLFLFFISNMWLADCVQPYVLFLFILCFCRVALNAPHPSAYPPPPGGMFSNKQARLLSSSRGNDHGVSASFENGICSYYYYYLCPIWPCRPVP